MSHKALKPPSWHLHSITTLLTKQTTSSRQKTQMIPLLSAAFLQLFQKYDFINWFVCGVTLGVPLAVRDEVHVGGSASFAGGMVGGLLVVVEVPNGVRHSEWWWHQSRIGHHHSARHVARNLHRYPSHPVIIESGSRFLSKTDTAAGHPRPRSPRRCAG